ncbi:HTH DNA binding protein [Caulobacter phage CcrRogue]|uniref:Putative HTH domain protein n=1 Tax=Caulobacter phage CcrRogue TaxID=2927986 RepID=K4JN40_9CAUD|nr:HTH DNA binding protein [Caulobacter phage CcrRogue]AFU86629.1 putative HTH domain protein [Caulobacter phage CcrRogue]
MPQRQKDVQAQADKPAGAQGGAQPGSSQGEAAQAAQLLSPEAIGQIGEALGGRTHWQASIARRVGVSKSQITRYLNGDRTPNTALGDSYLELMLDNLAELSDLLSTPGLPQADGADVAEAQRHIHHAVRLLRDKVLYA